MNGQVVEVVTKGGKPFQYTVRFDEGAEKALEEVKKYNKDHYIDDDTSSIMRSAMKFYRDFLYGKIKKE